MAGEGVWGAHDADSGTTATDLRQPAIRYALPGSHSTHRPPTLASGRRRWLPHPSMGACIALNEDALERLLDGPLQNLQPVFVPLAELHGAAVF